MSYDTIQAALYQIVINSQPALYTERNTREDDWQALDAPGTDIAAVLFMAGDTQEADAFDDHAEYGYRQAQHEVGIAVAVKIKSGKDSVAIATLQEATADLAAYIRARPALEGAALDAQVVRITRRMGINRTREANSATHWASTIVVRVWEQFAVDYVEQGG
jgi:uncharacterized protein YggU (UPF0235/DUF167 family)